MRRPGRAASTATGPAPPARNPRDSPPLGERVDPHALERAAREPPQQRRHQEADDEQDQRAAQARKEAAQLFLGVVQQGDRESAHGAFPDPPSSSPVLSEGDPIMPPPAAAPAGSLPARPAHDTRHKRGAGRRRQARSSSRCSPSRCSAGPVAGSSFIAEAPVVGVVAEDLDQLIARPVQPPLTLPTGEVGDERDLVVGHAFEVAQHEHRAVLGAKAAQLALETLGPLALFESARGLPGARVRRRRLLHSTSLPTGSGTRRSS